MFGAMSQRIRLTEELKSVIRQSRHKILDNCLSLLGESLQFFENDRYPRACFLAMTAIEEAGKLAVLRFVAHKRLELLGVRDPSIIEGVKIVQYLRDHESKAREAAAWSLYINAGADRRHGIHPRSGMHRTSGVILLVRSGRWLKLRNACLYVDLDVAEPATTSPIDTVCKPHAYYMICMAHEIIAEQADAAIEEQVGGDMAPWLDFEQARIKELRAFMERYASSVAVDDLNFLAEPDRLREEAAQRGK